MDRAELGRLLPDARIGPVTAAWFAPNDGQVEPPLVLAACRAVLEEAGTRPLPPLTDRVVYLPGGPGPPVHCASGPTGRC